MKLKWKVIVIINVIFILIVSFKILEPEIEEDDFKGDNFGYTASPDIAEKRKLLKILEDKYLLKTEYCKSEENPWKIAADWVKEREIFPEDAPELGCVLHSLKTSKVVAANTGIKGTQLKMSLILEGGQTVVFKPKWYPRDFIQSNILSGWDRHNGEIAAFHLARLLELRRAPIAVGRKINLKTEIIPVASDKLLKTFVMKDGNQCFYGKCYYCKEEEPVCANGDILEGVVILWLPQKYKINKIKSPWIRSYKPNVALRWQVDDHYCDSVIKTSPYSSGPRLMDIIDVTVLDYLIGNADRHHFESLGMNDDSMVLFMDNGKSFGDPHTEEDSILAPIRQCCKIRETTWQSLLILQDGVLSQSLKKLLDQDSISPVLHDKYYAALDRRLGHILKVVRHCIETKGEENVLISYKSEIV